VSHADVEKLRQHYIAKSDNERWGEAAAVAVLLGFPPVAGDDRFANRVTAAGVEWDDVLADKTWSPAERFLIRTACGIWGGWAEIDIARVAYLSDPFLATWLAMVSAGIEGRVPARAGGSFLIHAPAPEAGAALARWCAGQLGLTVTELPGQGA
jgi:hypothetical protein